MQFASALVIDDPSSYSWIRIYLVVSTNLSLVPTGNNPNIESLISELKIYPKNTESQSISKFDTFSTPNAVTIRTDGSITYKWDSPQANLFNIGFSSEAIIENRIIPIQNKIKFPIGSVNYPYSNYLEPTEHIDLNDDIVKKANELAQGEVDLYSVVFKIAEFVRQDVNYSLNSLTENAVQKSSWVYANKQGVCDEITSLFISMLRSLKIPAKFVEGVAYTNILDKWGNHGWAEVYFPDYGWVPFDVTYGQYGFVDSTHLKLGEADDSAIPSLTVTGITKDLEINAKELNINTGLIDKGEKIEKLELMKIEPLANQVGPSSYVPIRVELENLQPFYVPVQLKVTKAPGLTETNVKTVLLKPNQKRTVFWVAKIPSNIENDYIYSTVIEIVDSYGFAVSEKINYALEYETFTEEQTNSLLEKYQEKEKLIYSQDLKLDCKPGKNYYFDYEKAELNCDIENIGNVVLNSLDICIDSDCRSFNLNIAEKKTLKFIDLPSNQELKITAKNNLINLADYATIKSLNDPNLKISNLVYPDDVSYSANTNFIFLLTSDAPVKNAIFKLNNKKFLKLDNFNGKQENSFMIQGKQFYGKTYSNLTVDYEDENSHKYQTSKSFLINVKKVPFYMQILNAFKNIF